MHLIARACLVLTAFLGACASSPEPKRSPPPAPQSADPGQRLSGPPLPEDPVAADPEPPPAAVAPDRAQKTVPVAPSAGPSATTTGLVAVGAAPAPDPVGGPGDLAELMAAPRCTKGMVAC